MDWLIFGGIVIAAIALGVVAQKIGWIDLADKSASSRRGGGGGLIGIGDEVFSPARYETQLELELDRQTILPAPAPLAGDAGATHHGVYAGKVRIDL